MKTVTLKRIHQDSMRTFGVLFIGKNPMFLTLENPWRKNKMNISCIPVGEYTCTFVNSPNHGPTYKILGVNNRTNILIHKGNLVAETQGCMIIGSEFGKLGKEPAILNSGKAHYNFMSIANEEDFILKIEGEI